MSFREKRAWVTLIALIGVLILFWLHIPPDRMLAPPQSMWVLHVLLLTISTFVIIKLIAHIVMRIRSPHDARTPKDEREYLIELKGTAVRFAVLTVHTTMSLCSSLVISPRLKRYTSI